MGPGVVTLANVLNDYDGTTHVDGGTLRLGDSEVLPDATAVTVAAAATLTLANNDETIGSLAGAATAQSTIKIGLVQPLTGAFASAGKEVGRGFRIAGRAIKAIF